MKKQSALYLVVLLFFCALPSLSAVSDHGASTPAVANDEVEEVSPVQKNDDDVVERNPNYIGPATTEESDENDDATEGGSAKFAIGKALGFPKTVPRKTARFLKKHTIKITVALALFTFRKELFSLLWRAFSEPVRDPKTGFVVGRVVQIRPTAVLKILLFVYFMRFMQQLGDGNTLSPSTVLLLGRLTGNSGLALILSGLLAPSNPAYLPPVSQHYTFERINDRYSKDFMAYSKALGESNKPLIRFSTFNSTNFTQTIAAQLRHTTVALPSYNGTIVVVDWTGLDSSVSRLDVLRDEVSFLISCSEQRIKEYSSFEVVVLLESPGGSASDYALAAQQILRLRNQGLNVTVCVDKVAASGGYMIACASSPGRLFAAPFAIVGSIGVIGQSVNIHKVLEGWGVTPLVFRGGRDKAPVGLIGEVTKEGMEKVQLMVDDTHRAFKRHVAQNRPLIADRIEKIATGDIWLGYDALDMGLIDRIVTSDEYIGERIRDGVRVLKLYKIAQGRSIFSRPSLVAAYDSVSKAALSDTRSVLSYLVEFRSFLERAQTALGNSLANDFSSLTRVASVRDARSASSISS